MSPIVQQVLAAQARRELELELIRHLDFEPDLTED